MSTSRPEVTQAEDPADVRLAAAGDARAFERLYRLHVPRVHALARRMSGSDDAAELTQEVFVRVWEKLGSFRGESAFGTWLHRVAVNLILSRRSARSLHRSRTVEGDALLEQLPGRARPSDHRIDFERMVMRLPDGARQVLVLHDIEGYKHEEIARLLGVTSGTTKAQLHRARTLLRGHLEA